MNTIYWSQRKPLLPSELHIYLPCNNVLYISILCYYIAVSNEITITHQTVEGVDYTLVTQPGAEAVRACVVLPFNADPILAGSIPHEAPHVLEHVLCYGDGSQPPGMFGETLSNVGGSHNANTQYTIDGQLSFETTQPDHDHGIANICLFLRAVFQPNFDLSVDKSQMAIVKNELSRNKQNPTRQRYDLMRYLRGITYKTDTIGLETLDSISPDQMRTMYTELINKSNVRVVLSGDTKTVERLILPTRDLIGNIRAGDRFFSRDNLIKKYGDYHASAPEIPEGQTDYQYLMVVDAAAINKIGTIDPPSRLIIAGAMQTFLSAGADGLVEQSRVQGLSYGVNIATGFSKNQLGLSISDNTNADFVYKQIALLKKRIEKLTTYGTDDFVKFARVAIGRSKIYPPSLSDFAISVEQGVGMAEADVVKPSSFRSTLETINPDQVVSVIGQIAANFSKPQFVTRYSFGTNPFES